MPPLVCPRHYVCGLCVRLCVRLSAFSDQRAVDFCGPITTYLMIYRKIVFSLS